MSEENGSPDSIEPILAIRAWNLHREGERYFLASCYQNNIIWPYSTQVSAFCWANDPWMTSGIKHTAPITDCDCGIYGLKKMPDDSEILPWETDSVIGLAYFWGRVIEGTKGYRAQYSKPAALLKDDRTEILEMLSMNYSIPVVTSLNISAISPHLNF